MFIFLLYVPQAGCMKVLIAQVKCLPLMSQDGGLADPLALALNNHPLLFIV